MERITEGFFATDNEWKIVLWNSEAEMIVGKKRQEVLGKNLWECFPEAVPLKYYQYYNHALRKQVPVHFDEYYPPLKAWTTVSAFPSDSGLAVYFRKVDKKNEAPELERLLSLIAKETVYSVSLINFDGTISWINNAFTKITGYSFSEAIGKKQSELLLGPDTDEAAVEELKQSFYRHLPFQGEVLCYTRQKEKKWLFVSAQPVYDKTSGLYKYFFIQMDVTEQKKVIQQLEEHGKISTAAIINAQEKERTKLGQELHDNVNQILTSVKLYVELCRDNVGDKTKLLERSSELLQDVITELRSISHQLAAPPTKEINLEESIRELVKDFANTRKFEIELQTEGIKSLKVKEEIQITVYRILQEHLVNILKHAQASLVEIHTSLMDDELVIKVIDDGHGFDMSGKRTGIGLLNIKNRAESVNGSLVVNSKPGLGCVLIARIPLS